MTPEQLNRYSRHLILPGVGMEGQEKLLKARVLIIGMGGLGCPVAQYLTAAGIGTIGMIDFDIVDASNLQRQILYSTEDIGQPKVDIAARKLSAQNPDVNFVVYNESLTSDNALSIFENFDYIIDGTDNFATRYLVNDACVLSGKTNVYGSIFKFEGQVSIFGHSDGPCYRCLFPVPPKPGEVPNCAEGGVFGVLPGQVGVTQATEAIKLIIGLGEPAINKLMVYDALSSSWQKMTIKRNPSCPVCGDAPTITELADYEVLCGVNQEPVDEDILNLSPLEVKTRFDSAPGDYCFIDVREPFENQISSIEGTILIPLGQIEDRLDELAPVKNIKTIICHCQVGMRSMKALTILKNHGFTKLINVDGGMNQWIRDIK